MTDDRPDPPPSQYVYVLRPGRLGMLTEGPTPAERAAIADHVAHLEALVASGQVILFGRTQTRDADTFGLVVFEAAGDEAARALMEADPAVRAGVMTARLWPYRVAGLRARPG